MKIKDEALLILSIKFFIIATFIFPKLVLFSEILIIFLWTLLIGHKKIKFNFFLLFWILGIIIIFGIFNFNALDIRLSIYKYIRLIKTLFIGYILLYTIKNKERLCELVDLFIFSGILLIIRVLLIFPLDKLGKIRFQMREVAGAFNANVIGMNLSICLLFILFNIFYQKRNVSRNYFYFVIELIFMLLTGSKKAIALFLIGGFLFFLGLSENRRELIKRIFYSIFVLGIFISIFYKIDILNALIINRIKVLIETVTGTGPVDGSTLQRIALIKLGLNIAKKNIFLGYGLDQFGIIANTPIIDGSHMYSHNNYIELLVSEGVVGMIWYYLIYFYIIYFNLKILKRGNKLILIFFILSLFLMLLDVGAVSYDDRITLILIFLNYCVVENLCNNSIRRKNEKTTSETN